MRLAPQEIRTFFVTAVTWQRRPLFRTEPLAKLFLDTLSRYREQRKFQLHEFVVMPDHFHLLLTPELDFSLEKALQLIKGGFSFRAKRELGSNLEIWQPSFTEHRIQDKHDYAHHVGYIRENPVRARLVETAEDYPYRSAACALETDAEPPWLKPKPEGVLVSPG